MKTQPATGETYPKSDLFNKAESGLWSDDAIERQLSHSERNNVRAAYIHTSEHLDERRLMVQWWADYLAENINKFISPYDFAKKTP
ncbi:integrase [Klebsiella pneumoniae]|nr:integrase [Klebsiella pneumoniae]